MKFLFILGTLLCLAKGQENEASLKSLVVTTDIKVRYARTMVSAEYFNDKNSPAKAKFHVILPNRAYISNFSMEMNGNVSVGEVKAKKEAKKIYDDAVGRGESAGYVSVRHRYTKRFDMTVNIEPNVKVVFNLTYDELLTRTHGNYSHQIFLSNDKVIDKMLVEVFISEPQEIKVLEENIHENVSVRSVDYIDNKHVYIKFDPSREEQQKLIDARFNGEFTVEYDVDRNNSNVIYTLDGYFVHFFAPDDEPVWPKNIAFMVDVSGSMKGRKLRQVKAAMRKILSSLDPHKDTFTFGTFSRNVTWQHSGSLEEAGRFIASLRARGDTNINSAMLASLAKLEKEHPSNTADILFFLTDGEPTSGVTDKADIRRNIKAANKRNVLIFTLGFGENCDHEFLKGIAADNNGFSRKIYIDEDSDNQIKNMFNEVSSLLLKNVIITYVDSSIDVGKLTRNEFKTIFKGSEIAIAGPIKQGKKKLKTITAEIRAENAQTTFVRRQKLEFLDIDFDDIDITLGDIPNNPNITQLHLLQDITKKTWAYLSLKKMLEDNAPKEDIVSLAVEYGFVTPETSMVVTKQQIRGKESEEGKNDVDESGSQAQPPDTSGFQGRPIGGNGGQGPMGRADAARMDIEPSYDHHPPQQPALILPQLPDRILPLPTRRDQLPDHKFPMERKHTISMPDAHTTWIKRFSPFAATTATTTTPTPTPTPTPTTTTTTTTTTAGPALVPSLQKIPAIVVKPAKCNLMLCVNQETDCVPSSKMLLLKDSRADIEVYGETEERSAVTCVDNLYKITIKSRRKRIEITPNLVIYNRKRFQPKNVIRLRFKKFIRLTIFFNNVNGKKTISIKFFVQDHLRTAKGLYSKFMKQYDCEMLPTGEVTLTHGNRKMDRKFRRVTFTSAEAGFDHCYM